MHKKEHKRGFSLIEMMAVVAIIAVLVAIIMPTVAKAGVKARAATNAANLREVQGTLTTLRVSDYDAFMTAAKALDEGVNNLFGNGQASGVITGILNGLGGLGTALSNEFSAITATNGVLSLDYGSNPIEITAPPAKGIELDNLTIKDEAQMKILILDAEIFCTYAGYTAEDFADIAEDGEYNGQTGGSGTGGWDEWQCSVGGHAFAPNDDGKTHTCTRDRCNASGSCKIGLIGNSCQCGRVMESGGGNNPCVTPDTLVTLADGSTKRIDEITYADELLVWDFYNGKYATAPSSIIFNHGYDMNTVIGLTFSDGTGVEVVTGHRFFDMDANEFVYINAETVAGYVGHNFAKMDGVSRSTVELVDYTIEVRYEGSYSLMSAYHYNFIVADLLSNTFMIQDNPLFTYFEIGENMMYDQNSMGRDIETYGLYDYSEFQDYLTYEQFVAFNIPCMKISVGKGNFTYEGILNLIATYVEG